MNETLHDLIIQNKNKNKLPRLSGLGGTLTSSWGIGSLCGRIGEIFRSKSDCCKTSQRSLHASTNHNLEG